jgi:hypothetical protein
MIYSLLICQGHGLVQLYYALNSKKVVVEELKQA